MMKRSAIFFLLVVILMGCAASMREGKSETASIQYIDGVVNKSEGNVVTLLLNLPKFKKTNDSPIAEIVQQVVQKGLFVEGIDIEVNGISGSVAKIVGNILSVNFDKPQTFVNGTIVKVKIPMKRIAVADFTVIRGGIKEAGSIVMEGLFTALIESGYFTVVERTKLQTILEELKLSKSGLAEEIPEKSRQKLMIADLILTGTMAEIDNNYDFYLRLLNVRTGQAVTAISVRAPLFKPIETRDASEWNEDFETDMIDGSWNIGANWTKTALVSSDHTTGAAGSKGSLKVAFDFKSVTTFVCAYFDNKKKRDLSLYRGIEFYIKATKPITGFFDLDISDREDPYKRDRWDAKFEIETEWRKVRIPFNQLAVVRSAYIVRSGFKPGKQIMDMSRVENILIGTCNLFLIKEIQSGTIWIDKLRFYK